MPTIGSILQSRTVFSVQRTATVLEAVRSMAEKNIGAMAVLDGNRLVGIFSERDVITRVVSKGLDPGSMKIEQVMTKDLIIADSGESDDACLRKMKAGNCRHLPVISNGLLVGLISLRDLLQVELSERDEKLEFLTNYMFHLPPNQ